MRMQPIHSADRDLFCYVKSRARFLNFYNSTTYTDTKNWYGCCSIYIRDRAVGKVSSPPLQPARLFDRKLENCRTRRVVHGGLLLSRAPADKFFDSNRAFGDQLLTQDAQIWIRVTALAA